jgi:transcriptional regulator GlxA family with amidase domain
MSMPAHKFSDFFRELVGERPSQYLKHGQIQRAQYVPATTNLEMAAVARATAFRDAATFSRAFRRITGQTPQQYRRRVTQMHRPVSTSK